MRRRGRARAVVPSGWASGWSGGGRSAGAHRAPDRWRPRGRRGASGRDVSAGGYFTRAGGSAANYIAKWNGTSWSALGSGMGGLAAGYLRSVYALAVSDSDLYAGGTFTTAGGKVSAYIARAYL